MSNQVQDKAVAQLFAAVLRIHNISGQSTPAHSTGLLLRPRSVWTASGSHSTGRNSSSDRRSAPKVWRYLSPVPKSGKTGKTLMLDSAQAQRIPREPSSNWDPNCDAANRSGLRGKTGDATQPRLRVQHKHWDYDKFAN